MIKFNTFLVCLPNMFKMRTIGTMIV